MKKQSEGERERGIEDERKKRRRVRGVDGVMRSVAVATSRAEL